MSDNLSEIILPPVEAPEPMTTHEIAHKLLEWPSALALVECPAPWGMGHLVAATCAPVPCEMFVDTNGRLLRDPVRVVKFVPQNNGRMFSVGCRPERPDTAECVNTLPDQTIPTELLLSREVWVLLTPEQRNWLALFYRVDLNFGADGLKRLVANGQAPELLPEFFVSLLKRNRWGG